METSGIKYITSQEMKKIVPELSVVIDGIKMYPHSELNRPVLKVDEEELVLNKITADDIIIEDLHHVLSMLQGSALNLSGHLKVYLRTEDRQIIAIDRRLKIPEIFDDYLAMLHTFIQTSRVMCVNNSTALMKFVKSDLAHSIPGGAPRYAAYVGEDEVTKVDDFVKGRPIVVFMHVNPKIKCEDELMEKHFCISNDNLSTTTALSRIVLATERTLDMW